MILGVNDVDSIDCKIYDAKGKQLSRVVSCNTETGEIEIASEYEQNDGSPVILSGKINGLYVVLKNGTVLKQKYI